MADSKVSELTGIAGSSVDADNDLVPIVDVSAVVATRSKKISVKELVANTPSFVQSGTGASTETVQDELRRLSVSPEQFDSTGDGVTDDSTNFQKAATAAAGGMLTLTPGKTYLIANVSIPANTTVNGRGATLKLKVLATTVGSPILAAGGNNIEVYGVTFDGNKSNQPADGFHDSYGSGTNGKGRSYRAGFIAEDRTDIRVHHCHFKDTYGAGFASQNCDRISFQHNTALDLYFEMAFLSNTVASHGDYVIQGNRGKNFGQGQTAGGSVEANAILIAQCDRMVVTDNQLHNCERCHIKWEGGSHAVISDNLCTTNTVNNFPAINAQGTTADNLSITGNVIHNCGAGITLTASSLRRVTVSGNVIRTTTGTGASDGLQINGATETSDVNVNGNVLYDIKRLGIYVVNVSSRVKIANNILYGQNSDAQQGIRVETAGAAVDITLFGNHVENFVSSAVDDGVVHIARSASGTYSRLMIQGNTILSGASTNRALWMTSASDYILSGVITGNYIDGIANMISQAGVLATNNQVTGTNVLVGGTGTTLTGSATFDPGSLNDGVGATTTLTVSGAAIGDYVQVGFSNDLQGITVTGWVSAADTVSVRFQNESGGVLDLSSGTLRARVTKA